MKPNQIKYFNKILDLLLNHIFIFISILICIIIYIFYLFYKPNIIAYLGIINNLKSVYQDIIVGIILMLISLLVDFMLSQPKRIKKIKTKLKVKVYNKLFYLSQKNTNFFNVFITRFYTYNRKIFPEQNKVSSQVIKYLESPKQRADKCFWIEGCSYSGKTASIMHVFRDLISNNDYESLFQKLDGKIYYFDIGRDDFELKKFMDWYNVGKFNNGVIIIDNMHKLSFDNFNNEILTMLNIKKYFGLVFLIRSPNDCISENIKIDRMNTIMDNYGRRIKLPPLRLDNNRFGNDLETVFSLTSQYSSKNTNIILLHFASLYSYNTYYDLTKQITRFLKNEVNSTDFKTCFMLILIYSLFTGSFNYKFLIRLNSEINKNYLCTLISDLVNIGFLSTSPNEKEYYYLNEEVAKFYFKYGFKDKDLKRITKNEFYKLYKYYYNKNRVLSFLYSILGAPESQNSHELFNKIAININFKNLYLQMDYLLNIESNYFPQYYKELGILCDRIGNLKKARTFFMKLNLKEDIEAYYRLLQIDHSFYKEKDNMYNTNKKHFDVYINVLSKYWDIHMKMHMGIFDFESLYDLSLFCSRYYEEILDHNYYDGLHLMRRIYFDCFRFYYLRGILNTNKLSYICDNSFNLKSILKTNLHEFECYYKKFAIGLQLGYDVLFNCRIRGILINEDEYNLFYNQYIDEHNYKSLHSWENICINAINILNQSLNEMEDIADKTAIFVKYHLMLIKLCLEEKNYEEFNSFLLEYKNFAETENIIEYQIYAILFKIKLNLIQFFSIQNIASQNDYERNYLKEVIENNFVEMENTLNTCTYLNSYEYIRVKIYKILFTYFIKKDSKAMKKKLLEIKHEAKSKHYNRELVIIKFIEKRNFSLSVDNIRTLIKFYPIVPQ